MNGKIDISSLSLEEMQSFVETLGEKPFRGLQVFQWVNQKGVTDFSKMTTLSKALQQELQNRCFIPQISIAKKLVSKNSDTIKYLFLIESAGTDSLESPVYIESVFMRFNHGSTLCLSTQAGCKMNCAFCASGKNGFIRHLSPGEMCAQVMLAQKDAGERIDNIVLMGSGEPLDNFKNTMKFIELINSDKGLNIGQRHITLSTCGIVPKIYDLAKLNLQINLAVSLHAPNDEIRKRLMPVAVSNSMDNLLKACKHYSEKTKRRVTYEYALIEGLNDKLAHAVELGQKLRHSLSHVNLIPLNDASSGFKGASEEAVNSFAKELKAMGIEATVRKKMGSDINAACGQLVTRGFGGV